MVDFPNKNLYKSDDTTEAKSPAIIPIKEVRKYPRIYLL